MDVSRIRNFSIIAHIDHGKSTLADRMLEVTGTIQARDMRDQVLDQMELERERGITIKMQPVRMEHTPVAGGPTYEMNLIDTPGHIDFSYEVSRALKAVEGSILLVDATQGVQAQTLTTLGMARESGLTIIPVLSKVDSPLARVDDVRAEVANLLEIDPSTIMLVSGRTGQGVPELLQKIIDTVPPPAGVVASDTGRALVFDFQYSNHRGVIVYVRVIDGSFKKGDNLVFGVSGEQFSPLEVGTFVPTEKALPELAMGEIGYMVTGIKKPGIASVGDTITFTRKPMELIPGYFKPSPVVWASVYPESQDDFPELKKALDRLRLSDSSFSHEEETSGILGRGFRCGFLGMLHLEIITERLRREFDLQLIVTTPSITYVITYKASPGVPAKEETVYTPIMFPNDGQVARVMEPWVNATIITPTTYVSPLMPMLYDHEAEVHEVINFGDSRSRIGLTMPLREMMRNFFDELKSVSSGYASISYEMADMREADVTRLDIVIADEVVPAFSRVIAKRRVQGEAEKAVEKLEQLLSREQFAFKIQGVALGRILASKGMSAFKKDVTQHMYGGDITRRMKLWEKQKKGKKRMKAEGRVHIDQDVFVKMMKD